MGLHTPIILPINNDTKGYAYRFMQCCNKNTKNFIIFFRCLFYVSSPNCVLIRLMKDISSVNGEMTYGNYTSLLEEIILWKIRFFLFVKCNYFSYMKFHKFAN
jgi:hypothetical protein